MRIQRSAIGGSGGEGDGMIFNFVLELVLLSREEMVLLILVVVSLAIKRDES